jgi:hypothetical protein
MADGRRFDQLSRIWASPMSRRKALRLSAGVLFGAVGANLISSGRAWAPVSCTSNAQCTAAERCNTFCVVCNEDSQCGPGNTCVDPHTPSATCTCPGFGACNTVCCGGGTAGATCCPNTTDICVGGACCPSGSVCGSVCCPPSKVCLNAATGACGCPPGGPTCGNFCCRKGETCSHPAGGCCCPKGSTPCGTTCCASGVACLDPANGICGCPAGTTPCGSGANLTCCPAGTACHSGCPAPSNNTVAGYCSSLASDRNLKEHVVPVLWDQRGRGSRL